MNEGNLFITLKYGEYITLQLGDQIAKVVATERGGRGGCDVRLLIQAPKTINVQRSNRFKNKKEVPQGG
jgi:sRNA-binding carbon storage regulator CsrA